VTGTTATKDGTYGTLTLDTASGEYSFLKNRAAIEALDATESGSDVFTFTVTDTDGALVSQTFTVNVTGADEAPVTPTIDAPVWPDSGDTDTGGTDTGGTDTGTGTGTGYTYKWSQFDPDNVLSDLSVNDNIGSRPPQVTLLVGDTSSGLTAIFNPSDYLVAVRESFSYTLPQGIFAHTDSSASVSLEAHLSDGSALPSWLNFDADTGVFSGIPTVEYEDQVMAITVTAKDSSGATAEVTFRLKVGGNNEEANLLTSDVIENDEEATSEESSSQPVPQDEPLTVGKAGLSEQLVTAQKDSFFNELLDALST